MEKPMVTSNPGRARSCRECGAVIPNVLQLAQSLSQASEKARGRLRALDARHSIQRAVGLGANEDAYSLETAIEAAVPRLRGFCSADCASASATHASLSTVTVCALETREFYTDRRGRGFGPFKLTNEGEAPAQAMKLEVGDRFGVFVVVPSAEAVPAPKRAKVRKAIVEGLCELINSDHILGGPDTEGAVKALDPDPTE